MSLFAARVGLLLSALLTALPAGLHAAQLPERHHVIVLLDRSRSMLGGGGLPREQQLEAAIRDRLRRVCFTPGLVREMGDRVLLDPGRGDVLSIVAFGLNFNTARNFDAFVTVPSQPRALRLAEASPAIFDELWGQIRRTGLSSFFSEPWSGISLAMPLALDFQGRSGAREASPVARTFLVLVTDAEFNGGDPNLELGQLVGDLRRINPRSPLLTAEAELRERVMRAQSYYLFTQRGGDTPRGGIQLPVFEAIPNARTFGIESVWSFEHGAFRFHRVPGGFRSEFALKPVQESAMQPLRTEALLERGDSVLERREIPEGQAAPVLRLFLPETAAESDSLRVRLRFWVRQADEVYGMQILSPDGPPVQGSGGLVRTIPVSLEGPATVLGVLPLPFWAFRVAAGLGIRSQAGAAMFWNVALLLLFVLCVYLWIRKASTTRDPDALENEITLEAAPSTRPNL